MTRRVLLVALALASLAGLSACGDHRLTAAGYARVTTSGDARTGFELPTDVRIDGAATGVTGSCQVTRSTGAEGREYGVVVDLFGGSSDEGLRSITLMRRTDAAAGSVEARLGSGTFTSTAACVLDLTYVDDNGSVTLDATDCTLAAPDATTATADVHLEIHGCNVQ